MGKGAAGLLDKMFGSESPFRSIGCGNLRKNKSIDEPPLLAEPTPQGEVAKCFLDMKKVFGEPEAAPRGEVMKCCHDIKKRFP